MAINRVPRGVPTGGQFAAGTLSESAQELDSQSTTYQAPRSVQMEHNPNTTGWATEWWAQQRKLAESGHEQGDYPQMPRTWIGEDDRLHGSNRMRYGNKEVSLRMPSVTSIRSFAGKGKKTIDVPVSATTPHGNVMGWVRVTHESDGSWAVRSLNMDPQVAPYVSESVQALMEARRPSRSLTEVGDLLERRRQRAAALGGATTRVRSAWIDRLGYNPANQTMFMSTKGNNYGYQVPPHVYERVLRSQSPGSEFNKLVKGHSPKFDVRECPSCGRFSVSFAAHRCPTREAPRPKAVR